MRATHLIFLLPLVQALDVTFFFYKTSSLCDGQEFLRTIKPLGECARPTYAKKGELFSSVFGFASGIPNAKVFVYSPVEGRSAGDECVGSLARSDERWCGTANLENSISGARMMDPPGSSIPAIVSSEAEGEQLETSALFSQCNVGDHYGWHDDSDMFEIKADSDEGRHYDGLEDTGERLSYMKENAHCHTKIGTPPPPTYDSRTTQQVMMEYLEL
ncbi:hypothetical protein MMC14_003473 [Varicellaria rhodocarpa]|nr:hypothetical protein [Varicellaria rhodocarpa]